MSIITTNKMPTEWPTMLQDEVLATALLDRCYTDVRSLIWPEKAIGSIIVKPFFD